MSYPRPLAIHEVPEVMAAKLSEALGRPVLICSGKASYGGTYYRLPGETRCMYRGIPPLERYLSPLWSHRCAAREGDIYYFDMEPADSLCLAFPRKSDDSTLDEDNAQIRKILSDTAKLSLEIGGTTFPVDRNEAAVMENGLQPYIRRASVRRQHVPLKLDCVIMQQSTPFSVPEVAFTDWHENTVIPDTEHKGGVWADTGFTLLRPPGQYQKGEETAYQTDFSSYGVADRDPGGCIVCRGKSGQRKHFGAIHVARGSHLGGLICMDCFPGFASFLTQKD